MKQKTAQQVSRAIIRLLTPFASTLKTITVDIDKEFAYHRQIDQALGCVSYLADPLASCQRGANENCNELVCQYIPKSQALNSVSHQDIAKIMHRLNHRQKKRLNFYSPHHRLLGLSQLIALRS